MARYNPELAAAGKNPLQLDSERTQAKFREYALNEIRYKMLQASKPEESKRLMELAQADTEERWKLLKKMAEG